MQMYEIPVLMSCAHKKEKESWEQARLISYVIAQSNSTKKLKPTDIVKFAWDNEEKEDGNLDTSISNEDIERLKNKAKQYIEENGRFSNKATFE